MVHSLPMSTRRFLCRYHPKNSRHSKSKFVACRCSNPLAYCCRRYLSNKVLLKEPECHSCLRSNPLLTKIDPENQSCPSYQNQLFSLHQHTRCLSYRSCSSNCCDNNSTWTGIPSPLKQTQATSLSTARNHLQCQVPWV